MYSIETRVRYSEVGLDKTISMSQLVDYFQDCSTFHSEDIGYGIDYLEKINRAWLLCSWQIVVDRYPGFGEKIRIGTWPYQAGGLYAYRNFDLIDEAGIRIASANSIWFYEDTVTLKPSRITKEAVEAYGQGEKLPMDYAPRKIDVPMESKVYPAFTILKMHIDTNNHVNNSQYIEMAQEFLPKGYKIRQMRADYKKAAKLHDQVIPMVAVLDNQYTVLLCDMEHNPYVLVEFTSI